jgi:hypothetical protein
MSDVRNWASGVLVAALILLGPIIAFIVVIAAEVLTDLVTRASPLGEQSSPWLLPVARTRNGEAAMKARPVA